MTPQQATPTAGPDGLESNESIVDTPAYVAEPKAAAMMPPYLDPPPARATPGPRRVMPPVAIAPGNTTSSRAPSNTIAPRVQSPQRNVSPPAAPAPVTPHYIRIRPHPTDPNDPWPN